MPGLGFVCVAEPSGSHGRMLLSAAKAVSSTLPGPAAVITDRQKSSKTGDSLQIITIIMARNAAKCESTLGVILLTI